MSRRGWLAALAALAAVNARAAWVRHEGTFSHEVVRTSFRTDTRPGRVVLCLAWAALTGWVLPHWCRWPANKPRQSGGWHSS